MCYRLSQTVWGTGLLILMSTPSLFAGPVKIIDMSAVGIRCLGGPAGYRVSSPGNACKTESHFGGIQRPYYFNYVIN